MKSICVLRLPSNKRVQEFRQVREEEISMAVEKIINKGPVAVNLSETFMSVTNDIVCRSAFGRKHGEGESGKNFRFLLTELLQILGTSYIGAFIPWLQWINRVNGFDARIARVAGEIDRFLDGVIEERLEKKSYEYGRSCTGDDDPKKHSEKNIGEDFLDIMLRIHKDNSTGVAIDRDSVKAVVLDVFSAGTDTTATVAEWVMTELIRHPRVMKKLQEEVRGIMRTGKQSDKTIITDNDLEKMQYLKAVIKETLRLHPPIPLLVPRGARQDAEIMGYHIAAGSMVMINAWAIGRDPATWDHEPSEFLPERFLNSSIDYRGQDFQLIPFGAGRRGCPGIAFAMASNELMLANLVHRFDWELPNGVKGEDLDVLEHPGVTVKRKNPLMALATPFSL